MRHKRIDRGKLVGLMLFYFFATYAVLAIAFYASFLVDDYKISSSFSGVLISLFFLAIMLPGLFIDRIIRALKQNVNLVSLGLVCAGLLCVGIFRDKTMLVVGALLTGFGYGVIQPVIYDKAATIAPPRSATLALSFVMAMNYLAVMICPFIMDMFRHLFHTHSDRFPFFFNAALVFALAAVTWFRRGNFTLAGHLSRGLARSRIGRTRSAPCRRACGRIFQVRRILDRERHVEQVWRRRQRLSDKLRGHGRAERLPGLQHHDRSGDRRGSARIRPVGPLRERRRRAVDNEKGPLSRDLFLFNRGSGRRSGCSPGRRPCPKAAIFFRAVRAAESRRSRSCSPR